MERLAGGRTDSSVLRFLEGIRFPARKDDIVHAARQKQAPPDVVAALEQLSSTEFAAPQAVIDEYPHLQ